MRAAWRHEWISFRPFVYLCFVAFFLVGMTLPALRRVVDSNKLVVEAGNVPDSNLGFTNTIHDRVIFAFWTGTNEMGPQRRSGIESYAAYQGKFMLITPANLSTYLLPEHPLHPAFQYLSETHKADYLRTYFMHFHGGGYTDIKRHYKLDSWLAGFQLLEQNSTLMAVGYPEIGPGGVAPNVAPEVTKAWQRLIGNGAYIFRPRTPFTTKWFTQLEATLDKLHERLREHPAENPQGGSGYPVGWTQILGQIFHPLAYEYADYISQTLHAPDFGNYRNRRLSALTSSRVTFV